MQLAAALSTCMPEASPPSYAPPRRALTAALSALVVVGTIGWALSPVLLVEAPLLLVALNPIPRHVLMVSPTVEFLPLLAIVVIRRQLSCAGAYFVGETYGDRTLAFVLRRPPWGRLVMGVARLFGRAGIPLLILAPNVTAIFAGTSRMRFALFLPASLLGQLWVAAATYYVGDLLRAYIAPLMAFVREHALSLTMLSILLVVARKWWWPWARLRRYHKRRP